MDVRTVSHWGVEWSFTCSYTDILLAWGYYQDTKVVSTITFEIWSMETARFILRGLLVSHWYEGNIGAWKSLIIPHTKINLVRWRDSSSEIVSISPARGRYCDANVTKVADTTADGIDLVRRSGLFHDFAVSQWPNDDSETRESLILLRAMDTTRQLSPPRKLIGAIKSMFTEKTQPYISEFRPSR